MNDTPLRTSRAWKRLIVGKNFKVLCQDVKDTRIKNYRLLKNGIIEDDEWLILSVYMKKVQTMLKQYKVAEITTTSSSSVKSRAPLFSYRVSNADSISKNIDDLFDSYDRIISGDTTIFDSLSKTHKTLSEIAEAKTKFTHKSIVVDSSLDIKSRDVHFVKLNNKEQFSELIDVRFFQPGIIIGSQGLVIAV